MVWIMRGLGRRLQIIAFGFCFLAQVAAAQHFNFNVGGGPSFPLSPTSNYVGTSYNFVAGAGPNLAPHVKLVGEFMFNGLPLNQKLLDQAGVPSGKGRLYAFTGNFVVGTGNVRRSLYLVGGAGWYRRTVLAQQTVFKKGQVCFPVIVWWNVPCVDGIFPTTETIASYTSSAAGFNIGGGFTYAIRESKVNFYTELRYHHAFTNKIDTTVLPLTLGVRF